MAAKVVQFSIVHKGNKYTYKYNKFANKYFKGSDEISEEQYNQALQYFQSHR